MRRQIKCRAPFDTMDRHFHSYKPETIPQILKAGSVFVTPLMLGVSMCGVIAYHKAIRVLVCPPFQKKNICEKWEKKVTISFVLEMFCCTGLNSWLCVTYRIIIEIKGYNNKGIRGFMVILYKWCLKTATSHQNGFLKLCQFQHVTFVSMLSGKINN